MTPEDKAPEDSGPEKRTPEAHAPEKKAGNSSGPADAQKDPKEGAAAPDSPPTRTPSAPAKSGRGPGSAGPPSGPGGRGGDRGKRGRGGPGRGGRRDRRRDRDGDDDEARLEERVVQINRCATTVRGGRRMSFSALVVVGDRKGRVGIGFGKAKEVPSAVEKAVKDARRKLTKVALSGNTIPHEVKAKYRSSNVLMMPASAGTGVIAGATVRAVLECAGVHDILTKTYGNTNPINVAKSTFEGLKALRTRQMVERLRGVTLG